MRSYVRGVIFSLYIDRTRESPVATHNAPDKDRARRTRPCIIGNPRDASAIPGIVGQCAGGGGGVGGGAMEGGVARQPRAASRGRKQSTASMFTATLPFCTPTTFASPPEVPNKTPGCSLDVDGGGGRRHTWPPLATPWRGRHRAIRQWRRRAVGRPLPSVPRPAPSYATRLCCCGDGRLSERLVHGR